MSVNTNDTSNVYVNIEINSDNTKRTTISGYDVTRTRNIIDKCSDYYLSVIRFTIPSFYVPVLIFEPEELGSNIGQYSITLEYLGNIRQVKLIYTPWSNNGVSINPFDRQYYYVNSYVHFAEMVNESFLSAFNLLGNTPEGAKAPYIVFNPVTKLFTLFAQRDYYDTRTNTPIKVYFNDKLWSLLYAFPNQRLNQSSGFSQDGRDIQMLIKNFGNNISSSNDPDDSDQYLTLQQEYVTLYSFNPYSKILITSNLIPAAAEIVKGSGAGTLKIITDFIKPNDVNDLRSTYQYFPLSQYRLIDLLSDEPLRDIDLRVWWQDITGDLNPIELPWNSQINVKFAFLKKTLYQAYQTQEEVQKRMIDRIYNNNNLHLARDTQRLY